MFLIYISLAYKNDMEILYLLKEYFSSPIFATLFLTPIGRMLRIFDKNLLLLSSLLLSACDVADIFKTTCTYVKRPLKGRPTSSSFAKEY